MSAFVIVNGARIQEIREQRKLTRPDISAATGIPIETIRTLETRPQHSPRAETIALVAQALDVPMESLFDQNGDTA